MSSNDFTAAAKRISAAYRWLKLDLVLLAEESMHEDILDSITASLQTIGRCVLPKLGIEPLDPNEACKETVTEFVSVLSSFAPKTASRGSTACKYKNSTQTATASVGKIVQTSGQHIVLCNLESLVGEWQPLELEMVRRGNYLKCVDPVRTANAEGSNLHLAPEDMLRVVSQDADKDIQGCLAHTIAGQ